MNLIGNYLSGHSSNAQQNGSQIDIAVLKCSKPHDVIISKLMHYGIYLKNAMDFKFSI